MKVCFKVLFTNKVIKAELHAQMWSVRLQPVLETRAYVCVNDYNFFEIDIFSKESCHFCFTTLLLRCHIFKMLSFSQKLLSNFMNLLSNLAASVTWVRQRLL